MTEVGNRYFINSVATRYCYLLNSIAALPQPFLNKNSSELSLPLLLLHLKKFWSCFTDVGSILKNLTLKCFFLSCQRQNVI